MDTERLLVIGLAVVITFILLLVIGRYSKRREEERREAWRELAERTGLKFWEETGAIEGTYRGRRLNLQIYTVEVRTGDSVWDTAEHKDTRIALSVNAPPDSELSLSKRLILGGGELVGDKQFDQQFVIKSQPEGLAAQVFASPELQQRALQTRSPEFELAHRKLIWKKSAIEQDVEYLHSLFDLLCDVAEAVERAVQDTGD